jgi:hypothetical protein
MISDKKISIWTYFKKYYIYIYIYIMKTDEILKCLIALAMGYFVARMIRGNGFTQDINCKAFPDQKICEQNGEDYCMWDHGLCVTRVNCKGEPKPSFPGAQPITDCEVAYKNGAIYYNEDHPVGTSCQWSYPPMNEAYATQLPNYYQCVRDENKCVNSNTRCIPKE